ncbi:DEAD/DEAH box helicase [Salinispira pacifica]|uniref:DEAD/DEAH box helicase n=1 Tax=Salinispira pacifica TaxID=1307761 RepID=UPI0003FB7DFD|nr:DEAD/DEAH box helicase [Salinispira pacifica]
MSQAFSQFHPLIRSWFDSRFDAPTEIQAEAWRRTAAGEHLLISAPTGSGKTLSAFLWAINALIQGSFRGKVLYISPMKALNNDILRNLDTTLREIKELAEASNTEIPHIRTGIRSGDSSPAERSRLLKYPPDIFVTTPETLNIMLTSGNGRMMLEDISLVILDEIHVIAGSKRGTLLMLNLERLEALKTGSNIQRLGISATVRPVEKVASFLGGYESSSSPRRVSVIEDPMPRKYQLEIKLGEGTDSSWWDRQIPVIADEIKNHRSSIIFCNSRRAAEKASMLLNEYFDETIVFAHHGSLSREYRYWVEQELKEGRLRAVAATSTLELGIDVGDVDRVILLQAPFSLSSAVQRIGRSNHRLDGVSSAVFVPLHPREILSAVGISRAVCRGIIEEVIIPENCLDILAQMIISETAGRSIVYNDLYSLIRRSYPYRNLGEEFFRNVIEMLAGRFESTRIRELKPRLTISLPDSPAAPDSPASGSRLESREGLRYLIYSSGGTIPDRGYFELRISGSDEKIGELDEEFVFERSLGDRFTLGNRVWKIDEMDNRSVKVSPTTRSAMLAPFWRADTLGMDPLMAEQIAQELNRLEEVLKSSRESDAPAAQMLNLPDQVSMDERAAQELIRWVDGQRTLSETRDTLPGRERIVIEELDDPSLTPDLIHLVIHNLQGGRVNAPLLMCIQRRFARRYGIALTGIYNDDGVILSVPREYRSYAPLSGLTSDSVDTLLAESLPGSGVFGARFRVNAARALLILRQGFSQRTPLWLQRMRSKQLLERVYGMKEFPITNETWRELFDHDFALKELKEHLDRIESGETEISRIVTGHPGPFSSDIMWQLNNEYLYADDSMELPSGESTGKGLWWLRTLIQSAEPLPEIPQEILREYLDKMRRLIPEYAPGNTEELQLYLSDRRIISEEELSELKQALEHKDEQDGDEPAAAPIRSDHSNLSAELFRFLSREGFFRDTQAGPIWLHSSCSPVSREKLALEWLGWQGPVAHEKFMSLWGEDILTGIIDYDEVLELESGEPGSRSICLRETLERLLRMRRRNMRQYSAALTLTELQEVNRKLQGIHVSPLPSDSLPHLPAADEEGYTRLFESLSGRELNAGLLRRGLFEARLATVSPALGEGVFRQRDMVWTCTGPQTLCFASREDSSDYFPRVGDEQAAAPAAVSELTAGQTWELLRQGYLMNDSFQAMGTAAEKLSSPREKTPGSSPTNENDYQQDLSEGISSKRSAALRLWETAMRGGNPGASVVAPYLAETPLPGVGNCRECSFRFP